MVASGLACVPALLSLPVGDMYQVAAGAVEAMSANPAAQDFQPVAILARRPLQNQSSPKFGMAFIIKT
jgi:hypothetical protein